MLRHHHAAPLALYIVDAAAQRAGRHGPLIRLHLDKFVEVHARGLFRTHLSELLDFVPAALFWHSTIGFEAAAAARPLLISRHFLSDCERARLRPKVLLYSV